jgi:hypothetical protein
MAKNEDDKKGSKVATLAVLFLLTAAVCAGAGYLYALEKHECPIPDECDRDHLDEVFDCVFCHDKGVVPVFGFDDDFQLVIKWVPCAECA